MNKNVEYLLCAIDDFTEQALVKPLKDKTKPNKLQVDLAQGIEFT